MRLTVHTDYAIRALIYLSVNQDRLVTINDISEQYNISKNHMMKVAQELVQHNFVISERGRNGGLRLSRPPSEICLAEIVDKMESDFYLVTCLCPSNQSCKLTNNCGAETIMNEALAAFMAVLRKYSLMDAVRNESLVRSIFEHRADIQSVEA